MEFVNLNLKIFLVVQKIAAVKINAGGKQIVMMETRAPKICVTERKKNACT